MVSTTVCQSCAMPLAKPADHGTEADGARNQEFCTHCYQGGSYTDPNVTLDQMVEIVARFMEKSGDEATRAAREGLIDLKRWR